MLAFTFRAGTQPVTPGLPEHASHIRESGEAEPLPPLSFATGKRHHYDAIPRTRTLIRHHATIGSTEPHPAAGGEAVELIGLSNLRQRAFVPGLLLIGMVVSVISSLGAPLIPGIATTFGTSVGSAQWSLTLTLLLGAVSAPVVGRLGDGPHRRTVLLGCLAAVSFGGVLAATASSLPALLVGRALQGLGLAIMPLSMAAARDALDPERARRTIAALSVIGAVGIGLGYPVTGVIARYFDVSAAFWFGVATSTTALAIAFWVVPSVRTSAPRQRIDAVGAVLVMTGLAGFLLAFENGTDWGWLAPPTLGLGGGAILLLAVWTRHSLRTSAPLVDLRLLHHPSVASLNVSAFLLGISTYLVIALWIQFVQVDAGLGLTVLDASLTLVPMSIASLLVSAAIPRIEPRIGARALVPVGGLAMASAAGFSALTGDALWHAFVATGLLGAGMGLSLSAFPNRILTNVPAHETSSAMSLYQVTRYVGYTVGSGLAVSLLSIFAAAGQTMASAYATTFAVAACFGVAAAAIARRFDRDGVPPVDHAGAGRQDRDRQPDAAAPRDVAATSTPTL
jgi:predicted MFS family arabinose efflux permease